MWKVDNIKCRPSYGVVNTCNAACFTLGPRLAYQT